MKVQNKHYKTRSYVRKLLNNSGFPPNKWFSVGKKDGVLVVRLNKNKNIYE